MHLLFMLYSYSHNPPQSAVTDHLLEATLPAEWHPVRYFTVLRFKRTKFRPCILCIKSLQTERVEC
jgi:hypothetical protein